MIRKLHTKGCASHAGKRCRCDGSWQARISRGKGQSPLIRSFGNEKVAREWAALREREKQTGDLVESGSPLLTVEQYGERVIEDMHQGKVRKRRQEQYKSRTIQLYADNLRLHVFPRVGDVPLDKLRRRQVQGMVDELVSAGKSAETIRNCVNPLSLIYRIAVRNELVETSPVDKFLELPEIEAPAKVEVEGPELAVRMIAAVKDCDRALWGCAFYAGLRRGEIAGLRWEDIHLTDNELHVEQAHNPYQHRMEDPKTKAGKRPVFIIPELRRLLLEHRALTGRRTGLVFGVDGTKAFTPGVIRKRSNLLWERAGLKPMTLQEARRCFATWTREVADDDLLRARLMGHTNTRVTDARYVQNVQGQLAKVAEAFQEYLSES